MNGLQSVLTVLCVAFIVNRICDAFEKKALYDSCAKCVLNMDDKNLKNDSDISGNKEKDGDN